MPVEESISMWKLKKASRWWKPNAGKRQKKKSGNKWWKKRRAPQFQKTQERGVSNGAVLFGSFWREFAPAYRGLVWNRWPGATSIFLLESCPTLCSIVKNNACRRVGSKFVGSFVWIPRIALLQDRLAARFFLNFSFFARDIFVTTTVPSWFFVRDVLLCLFYSLLKINPTLLFHAIII